MQFEAKLTLDGLMTLIAGLIAFIAVIIQIRSSSRQVREQITAQRDAEREEQKRQNLAVATAILFEIDNIYRSMIRGTGKTLEGGSEQEFLVKPHSLRFPIYEGNTSNLGRLPGDLVQNIVEYYGVALRHITTLQEYSASIMNAHEAKGDIDWKGMASQYCDQIAKTSPWVKLHTYYVTRSLCEYTGIEFKSPTIAVAAENLTHLQEVVKKIEEPESNTNR